ncbi:hypothetical protein [uncultured Roseobacter sp.]|uniref:hypothetical protein n=1 Tax=uncultured Roseobacter sp. TaxID=114847 RepID=UPI00261F5D0B|nr:hypothetical protein [uncultured Roseobacter sp.]
MLQKKGIFAIVGLVLVFAVVHLAFPPEQHDPRTTGTVMLGGIAFLLMTSSIILSTRLEVFEDWFGGLDRMYQVQRLWDHLDHRRCRWRRRLALLGLWHEQAHSAALRD